VFVDQVLVHLRSGDGGAGVVAFIKKKGRLKGKPVGGSGGAGGSVILEADQGVSTLLDFRHNPHRVAPSGSHGSGDLQHGSTGDDLILLVPPGTVVRDAEGTLLADLAAPGQRLTALAGGRGGLGNAALASRRRVAPDFAEQGEYGEQADFTLELKLVSDAALIGFPNAGKSTLIAAVSAARPKIADYPFTTLVPNLGVVDVDGRRFVLADIPGLIEGAADGRGLGHEFLKHAERSRVLVYLLDPSPLQETGCVAQYRILRTELARHDPELAGRPSLVAVSKSDLPDAEEAHRALADEGIEAHLVSGATHGGLEPLMHSIADLLGEPEARTYAGGYLLHRPGPPGFEIVRRGERWIVKGRAAERAVALDDLTNPDAADFAGRRLARAGVEEALRARGAQPGDEVEIGDIVFELRDEGEEPG
jgi:GTP-binding protein